MDSEFRTKVKNLGEKGVDMISDFFEGAPILGDKLKVGMFAMREAVKVSHMDQLKAHGDKSLALRLFQFLPKDEEVRTKYLKITNPELKPLLLDRPKKTKDK